MDALTLWLAKYLVLGLMLVIGFLTVWLVVALFRAVRWCWRRVHRWSRA
ncbi:hypothetical protein [Stenotrophomonas sp.]|nr:hypothetical protein [Stenotrophomonas sp.]